LLRIRFHRSPRLRPFGVTIGHTVRSYSRR
jgi:hypothetical protein